MVYYCSACDTKCDTNKRFEKHCQTAKHLKNVQPVKASYKCECGNVYSHKPSLSRHRKTCEVVQSKKASTADTNGQCHSQCQHPHPSCFHCQQTPCPHQTTQPLYHSTVTNNITHIGDTINHINNPVFNFNIYLNEQCRDAICIEEFCNTLVERIRSGDDPKVNISFIDNKEAFSHILGNLMFMNSVKRPIQSFQGEILEKSNDDWKTLTLDKLNSHVTGITSQVNWAKFSGLPQPVTSNELMQNMIALRAATQIHPPLRTNEMEQLRKATQVKDEERRHTKSTTTTTYNYITHNPHCRSPTAASTTTVITSNA